MTILNNIINLFYSIKDKNLQWQQANQSTQTKLKQARILTEKALEAELRQKSVKLEHDISLLKTKQDADLSMLKIKCKQDIKDYKQYLSALDKLKSSIQASYTHLPEAVAFTIHHHAKFLLNQMWEAEDVEQKMRHEIQLIRFMTTVHEDARSYLEGATTENLPEKTLNLIQQQ
jgi:transcriptional regulator